MQFSIRLFASVLCCAGILVTPAPLTAQCYPGLACPTPDKSAAPSTGSANGGNAPQSGTEPAWQPSWILMGETFFAWADQTQARIVLHKRGIYDKLKVRMKRSTLYVASLRVEYSNKQIDDVPVSKTLREYEDVVVNLDTRNRVIQKAFVIGRCATHCSRTRSAGVELLGLPADPSGTAPARN